MISDTERREVARRLRECRGGWSSGECYYTIIHALGLSDTSREDGGAALYAHLADLIEPGDTSQGCRDPIERGVDSIYDWCFERIEGADGAEDYLYCSIMSAIEEYRHPERATANTVRPIDRDALLALADEIDRSALELLKTNDQIRIGSVERCVESTPKTSWQRADASARRWGEVHDE